MKCWPRVSHDYLAQYTVALRNIQWGSLDQANQCASEYEFGHVLWIGHELQAKELH